MLYREIIAVCSQIHTKHINTLCGLNSEFLNVVAVHIVITGLARVIRVTEVTGILDMGSFQQHDLQTYIKFHYNTALQNKLSTHCITINSRQHSQSSEANSSSASHEIPMQIIRTDHPPISVLIQINLIKPSHLIFYAINFNIVPSAPLSSKRSFFFILPNLNPAFNYFISHACHMPLLSHHPRLNLTFTARSRDHEAPPYVILSTLLSFDPQHPVKTPQANINI